MDDKIGVGDAVVFVHKFIPDNIMATPVDIPVFGKIYRITDIVEVDNGLACSLEGMNPSPYQFYQLCTRRRYYFRKVHKADGNFIEILKKIKDKNLEPVN